MMRVFPKRLGIVWFQGEENLKKTTFIENIYNWRLINPDWEVIVLDDRALRQICKNYSDECLKVYDSFDIMHLKIDFGRYVSLWETVSMYVDIDCFAFRSLSKSIAFSNFVKKYEQFEHILGLSKTNTNVIEKFVTNLSINNAIMISSPRNPVVKQLIDSIIMQNLDYKPTTNLSSTYFSVLTTTGPIMFNKFFENIKTCPNVYIEKFPFYMFEPGQNFQNFDIRDETVALHKFEMSWLSPQMKVLTQSYYDIIKPYFFIFVIAVLVLLLIYKYYYTDCTKRCRVLLRRK